MQIEFDHVGILVRNVVNALESLRQYNWPVAEIEEFPTEGTREVYIGPTAASGRLLLLEPIGAGPYRNALEKRGPGLHHIAITVDDMRAFIARISGSGWYLHPQSLDTLERHRTVWLARPGVPSLIEVVQSKLASSSERIEFATRIELPLPESKPQLFSAINIEQIQPSPQQDVYMTLGGNRLRLTDLFDSL